MEPIYFKGLEELLNQGCYIKIYSRVLFYVSFFVVDVEKYDCGLGVFGFAEEQTTPVRGEYQMKLSDKKKRK